MPAHARPVAGFPLGEPLLYLRAVTDDKDRNICCSLENVFDQQLALIQPVAVMPGERHFAVFRPDGAVLLYLSWLDERSPGEPELAMQVTDANGRLVGRLRRTTPVAQFSRCHGGTLGLEANRQWLGATEIHQNRSDKPIPIFDGSGTRIGRIYGQLMYSTGYKSTQRSFSDYLLDVPQPKPYPMPELMLAGLFAQYLAERIQQGPVSRWFGGSA